MGNLIAAAYILGDEVFEYSGIENFSMPYRGDNTIYIGSLAFAGSCLESCTIGSLGSNSGSNDRTKLRLEDLAFGGVQFVYGLNFYSPYDAKGTWEDSDYVEYDIGSFGDDDYDYNGGNPLTVHCYDWNNRYSPQDVTIEFPYVDHS